MGFAHNPPGINRMLAPALVSWALAAPEGFELAITPQPPPSTHPEKFESRSDEL